MSTSYDPPNLPELVEKKAKIRMALREEYIKQVYNPHRHATGYGGVLFDPAHQRYLTMTTNRHVNFKPTLKTSFLGLSLFVIPFALVISYTLSERKKQEAAFRSGTVSYADRKWKFV